MKRSLAGYLSERYLAVPLGTLVAIVWANTHGSSYFRVAEALAFAVNDVGMAFVLAFLAQEVVEAMLPGGSLHPTRRGLLPVVAAVGGVLGALTGYDGYILAGDSYNLLEGWPIASAVDIVFCYFLASAIFRRGSAVTFLLLLAIVSDGIGLALVSYRYPVLEPHPAAAALMIPAVWTAARFRRSRLRTIWAYVLLSGTLSWLALYWSGIHPALALLPIVPFLPHAARDLDLLADPARERHRSAAHFEYVFRQPVHAIMFLFALVNAGVLIRGFGTGTWTVLTGALGGRPAGILIAAALGVSAGLQLPRRMGWRDLTVLALVASPAFTVGLFFAAAVFPVGPLLVETKMGAIATVSGAFLAIAAARLLRVGRFARSTT